MSVFWIATGFSLSDVFWQIPAATELFRYVYSAIVFILPIGTSWRTLIFAQISRDSITGLMTPNPSTGVVST